MPGVVVALTAIVAVTTIALMFKTRGRPVGQPPVIALFGFGLIAVMLVGGQFFRDAQRRDDEAAADAIRVEHEAEVRDYKICKAAVEGRIGLRNHLDWLYGKVASGPQTPEREAFLEEAQRELNEDIPVRTLEKDCPPDPDAAPTTTAG